MPDFTPCTISQKETGWYFMFPRRGKQTFVAGGSYKTKRAAQAAAMDLAKILKNKRLKFN